MSDRVWRYYQLGCDANDQGQSTTAMAIAHGLGISTARKAKDFARKYTTTQVEAFLKLRRPNGSPLHWGYVLFLLTLPHESRRDKERRRDLEKAAAAQDWTAPELYQQIKRRVGRNRRWASEGRGIGGRKRKGEPGSREYIHSLVELAGRLTRGLEGLQPNTPLNRDSADALKSSLAAIEQAVGRVKRQLAA